MSGKEHSRLCTSTYEVHRACAVNGMQREPIVETFGGLDRARIAALGWALDGQTVVNECFTGEVSIYRITAFDGTRAQTELVDAIDERVAFRVLNELTLPRAEKLAVSIERMQAEADQLARLGF